MKTKINNIVRAFSGSVLILGVEENFLSETIKKNRQIVNCTFLSDQQNETSTERTKTQGGSTINIRHLRKKWKYKKIDYILGRIEEVEPYLKYFVKDSIYMTKHKITLYTEEKGKALEQILAKYKRYHVILLVDKTGEGTFLTIENKETKKNRIKDRTYLFLDTVNEWLDMGSDLFSK